MRQGWPLGPASTMPETSGEFGKRGQTLTQIPPDHKTPQADDEPPPFLGTWRRIYAFVLIHLALWILVFYFFTERFHSPL